MDEVDNLAYMVATLIDHFHLTPIQIGQLTRVQISELFFHKRDEDNNLVRPVGAPRPLTPMTKLDTLKLLKRDWSVKGIDEAIAKLESEKDK